MYFTYNNSTCVDDLCHPPTASVDWIVCVPLDLSLAIDVPCQPLAVMHHDSICQERALVLDECDATLG